MLYGCYGSGKSFVAVELAGCISQGRPFAGRPIRRGRVLVLLAEGSSGMRDRFDAMVREGLIDPSNIVIDDSGRQIGKGADREALIAELAVQNFKPELIIVDTLARHAVGVEENSAREMGAWIAGVEALATEFGCTVLLVHHAGKSAQNGMRGSSALVGAISTAIECEKGGDLITLKCEKQKDADAFAPISFRTRKVRHGEVESLILDHVDGNKREPDRLKPVEASILRTLEVAYPRPVKRRELLCSNGTGIKGSTFDRARDELIKLGLIEKWGHGEYVLSKSPSPDNPQESPMGISSAPDKSPPAPPPYKGGDVGIWGGDQEGQKTDVRRALPEDQAVAGLQGLCVPKFDELKSLSLSAAGRPPWPN